MNPTQEQFSQIASPGKGQIVHVLRAVLLMGVCSVRAALAQGTIELSNSESPFLNESGARLAGTNYSAQLYAGYTADTLMPMGLPVSFLSGSASGYCRGVVVIPFVPPGATVWVQVRAWDATAGQTFEQAVAAGGWTAFSNILYLLTGGGGSPPIPPAALTGLRFLGSGRLPRIQTDPTSQTVEPGQDVRLFVSAINGPLSYQWRKAGAVLAGETNAALTISNVKPAHSGNYDAVVANPAGIQISPAATLTVNVPPGSPVIREQPRSQRGRIGESVSLSVIATGQVPLFYQWYEGPSGDLRSRIAGASDSNYVV